MKRLGPRWTQNLGLHIFDLCKATSFPNHEAAFSSLDWISPSCLATVKPKGDSEVLLRFLCGGSALAYSMEMECVLCWTIPTPQTVAATMMSLEPAIRVVEKSRNARKKEIHVAKYPAKHATRMKQPHLPQRTIAGAVQHRIGGQDPGERRKYLWARLSPFWGPDPSFTYIPHSDSHIVLLILRDICRGKTNVLTKPIGGALNQNAGARRQPNSVPIPKSG